MRIVFVSLGGRWHRLWPGFMLRLLGKDGSSVHRNSPQQRTEHKFGCQPHKRVLRYRLCQQLTQDLCLS